jgi:hypothetical protein
MKKVLAVLFAVFFVSCDAFMFQGEKKIEFYIMNDSWLDITNF